MTYMHPSHYQASLPPSKSDLASTWGCAKEHKKGGKKTPKKVAIRWGWQGKEVKYKAFEVCKCNLDHEPCWIWQTLNMTRCTPGMKTLQ